MILNVQGIRFYYPGRPVLEEASFTVEKGEILAILGTNGTGKTTLLKCINRILMPESGRCGSPRWANAGVRPPRHARFTKPPCRA